MTSDPIKEIGNVSSGVAPWVSFADSSEDTGIRLPEVDLSMPVEN
jgi:hypothetical protein